LRSLSLSFSTAIARLSSSGDIAVRQALA